RWGALGAKGKAALVMGVDQLIGDGRLVDENAKPAKGIDALESGEGGLGHALAADAVETVAAGNVAAVDAMGGAILGIGDIGAGVEIMQFDIFGVVDGRRLAGRHEIARYLGLAVDH